MDALLPVSSGSLLEEHLQSEAALSLLAALTCSTPPPVTMETAGVTNSPGSFLLSPPDPAFSSQVRACVLKVAAAEPANCCFLLHVPESDVTTLRGGRGGALRSPDLEEVDPTDPRSERAVFRLNILWFSLRHEFNLLTN